MVTKVILVSIGQRGVTERRGRRMGLHLISCLLCIMVVSKIYSPTSIRISTYYSIQKVLLDCLVPVFSSSSSQLCLCDQVVQPEPISFSFLLVSSGGRFFRSLKSKPVSSLQASASCRRLCLVLVVGSSR